MQIFFIVLYCSVLRDRDGAVTPQRTLASSP